MKEIVLLISLIVAALIGLIIYDYQVRKQGEDLVKRIATIGKRAIKSPIALIVIIWAYFNNKDNT